LHPDADSNQRGPGHFAPSNGRTLRIRTLAQRPHRIVAAVDPTIVRRRVLLPGNGSSARIR
ncbi:MAG TPA: hypothetical protein VLW08_03485, partial [Casimicrobiaceae bacterium]|nr:hypothetical protein [Casimicrobiaceae bacterium]